MVLQMTDIYAFVKPGDPVLDFANSKVWDTRSRPFGDLFTGYEPVVRWFRHLNLLTEADVDHSLVLAAQNPALAQTALERIITLRDANYNILVSLTRQQQPSLTDLETLTDFAREAATHRRLVSMENGIQWTWTNDESCLDWALWPIAQNTTELLASDRASRLRECGGCYWLFMDTSRNGLRRWCDMKTCGNRAKARRHYEKTKSNHQPRPT